MADIQPGTVLDNRFEIAGVLGRGGMATVYLASDRLRGEHVALKVLHDHLAGSPSMRARLRREVVASGRIHHPNALVARDIHELDGHLALSMPFHPGRTLDDYLSTVPELSAKAIAQMGTRLADALAAAHKQGIVHRDVTPTNILVDEDGNPSLTDFGLARLMDFHTATATGVMGTTGYAAPETYRGHRGDPRSDIYSLGAVLYFASTGKPPFDAPSAMGILEQQETGAFTPLAERRPDLPPALCQTIDAMLARDPQVRPQSAAEVARSLQAALSGEPSPLVDREPAGSRDATRGQDPAPRDASTPGSRATSSTARGIPGSGETRKQKQTAAEHQAQPLVLRPLPSGPWSVLVREHSRDEHRRSRLRRKYRRRRSRYHRRQWRPPVEGLPAIGDVWDGLKAVLSIPDMDAPEVALTRAVSREAGLPEDALTMPPAMLAKRFRLVAGVDEACAQRLVLTAKKWGFRAQLHHEIQEETPFNSRRFGAALAVAMIVLGLLSVDVPFSLMIVMVLVLGLSFRRMFLSRGAHADRYPLVFERDLRPYLAPEYRNKLRDGLSAAPVASEAVQEAEENAVTSTKTISADRTVVEDTRAIPADGRSDEDRSGHGVGGPQEDTGLPHIQETVARTSARIDELEHVFKSRRADLPEIMVDDLTRTISALRAHVRALGKEADILQQHLSTADDDAETRAVARIEARLERLKTIQRTGAAVDSAEMTTLEQALAEHRRTLEVIESWESRSTRILARLLEIGSTVRQAMLDLERTPGGSLDTEPTQDLIRRLKQESTAAAQALGEVARLPDMARKPVASRQEGTRTQNDDQKKRAAVHQQQRNRR